MGDLTGGLPKLMLKLGGQTLLAHQRRSLVSAGIEDISLVLGHGGDAVQDHPDAQGFVCYRNSDYASTNMVASLLCATDLLDGSADLIVAYGDIVYEPRLVAALLDVDAPVSIVVDLGWREYWEARMPNPLEDAETLKLDKLGRVVELGKRPENYSDIQGQYTGLIRISAKAAAMFASAAHKLALADPNTYMTSLLQHLIDNELLVKAAVVSHGWLEIDQASDLNIEHDCFYDPTYW